MTYLLSYLRKSKKYFFGILLIAICSIILILAFKVENANAVWGDKVIPIADGSQLGARDVNGFISEINGWVGQPNSYAQSVIDALGGNSTWGQNLARVTRVEYASGYEITQTTIIDGGGNATFVNLDSPPQFIYALIFYIGDQVYFAIDATCGNIVVNPSLPTSPNWTLRATTTVDRTTAIAGDTINWTHKLVNNGPDNTNSLIHSNLTITGIADWSNPAVEYGSGDTSAGASPGVIRTISDYSSYTVKDTDVVGSWLCENVKFDPINSSGDRQGSSAPVCVIIKGGTPPAILPPVPGACSNPIGYFRKLFVV